jgi:hypothetical protein
VVAVEGDFFGDGEIVLQRLGPVDEMDGFGGLAYVRLHGDAVAQQLVHRFVVGVGAAGLVVGLGAESVDGFGDLGGRVAGAGEIGGEEGLLDVGVVVAVAPVAEVGVVEFIAE